MFANLPKPIYDETFTSWIYRCSRHNHQMASVYECLVISSKTEHGIPSYEDPDFDSEGSFFQTASCILRRDASKLYEYFKPRDLWVVPWNNRHYFCPDCILQDVAQNKLPSWRKSWCYVTTTHCELHKTQLCSLSTYPTKEKAWQAFQQVARERVDPSMSLDSRKWLSKHACKLRYMMCLKVTNWLARHSQPKVEFFKNAIVDKQYVICFKGIMELLLQPSTQVTAAGYAKHAFKLGKLINRTPFLSKFPNIWRVGALLSTAHERMSAIMLAGWIMSLYSDEEMKLIYRIFESTGCPFPKNKKHLASFAVGFEDRPTYQKMRSMFYPLKLEVLNCAGEYLSAIETHSWMFTSGEDFLWRRKYNVLIRWTYDPYDEPSPEDI